MDATKMKRFYFPVVKGETIGNIASATITTNDLDRQNEVIEPDGMTLANYMANPVVLYGHTYSGIESIPVGRTTSLEIVHEGDKKAIRAQWEWQADDVTPFISAVKKSWERGFIGTVSVGFLAQEYQDNVIAQSELLEFSIVPVPANPMALRLNGFTDAEVKALGVDVTPETLIADLEAMVVTKEGRVLSTKNRDMVQGAVDSLTTCVSSLKALLDMSDGKMLSGDSEPEPVDDWLTALYKSMFYDKK